jgi:hypothetical protein
MHWLCPHICVNPLPTLLCGNQVILSRHVRVITGIHCSLSIMPTSTWEIPTSSDFRSECLATVSFPEKNTGSVANARCAPVVLSRAEASILLGLSLDKVTDPVDAELFDRKYLSEIQRTRNFYGRAATINLEEQLTGFSATSSISSQATHSSNGNRKYSHLDFVNPDELNMGREQRTTFMIRRLPRYISSEQLVSLLNRSGYLRDSVDLVYVPIFTGKAHANRGYAFVNFRSPQLGALFMTVVRHSPETELSKQLGRCDIVYAHIQSKDAMLANLTRIPSGAYWNQAILPPGLLLL